MNLKRMAATLAVCMIGGITLAQNPMAIEPTHYKLALRTIKCR